jgi:hypothetical protein
MLNRIVLTVIVVFSIGWIAYVGYSLLDRREHISPELIFGNQDGEVLIINRTQEVNLTEISAEFLPQSQAFVDLILANPVQNERIYISKKRNVVVIETPMLWSRSTLMAYFQQKEITVQFSGSNTFKLNNGFFGRYQRNFILLHTDEYNSTQGDIKWPFWDQKSTASRIVFSKPISATDIYFKADGTISYQSKYNKASKSEKVDDQELFAEVLPNQIADYHFYEREFALQAEVLTTKSPLYKWSESGFVSFIYEGQTCIISDFANNRDPFLELNEINSDTIEYKPKSRIADIKLTANFPKNIQKGFYMMYIADKVVISESKELCEKIVAGHQLGKTLALTENARLAIYDQLPRRVSERFSNSKGSYTNTVYKNILIKTQATKRATGKVEEGKVEPLENSNWTQGIDGKIEFVLGRKSQQVVWTSNNKVLSVLNKKKLWEVELDGKMIGEPQWIDLLDNGNNQILFNTATSIYLIQANGEMQANFPIKIDAAATNPVTYYRWKGVGNFVLMNDKNQLMHFDNNGRELEVVKTSAGNTTLPITVFGQKGNLIATINGTDRTQTMNLERHRFLKDHKLIEQKSVVVKAKEGVAYYSFKNGSLQRQDYTGSSIILGNYQDAENLKIIEGSDFLYIAFSAYHKIHILNEEGIKMFQIDIPFRELASYDVITLQNGKTYVAMIDGIENSLYLFDSKGNSILKKPLEGKDEVNLSEKGNNNLVITTSGNGFVVQYFNVLRK